LEGLIEEFNALSDLTVKLNSQVKICKIIEEAEICYHSAQHEEGEKSVKQIMDECKDQL
jgi:hypothetical protein